MYSKLLRSLFLVSILLLLKLEVIFSTEIDEGSNINDGNSNLRKAKEKDAEAKNSSRDSKSKIKVVDNTSLHGKIMAGYQGWFMTPNDGGINQWRHWANNEIPNPNTCKFDLWPDLSEFDADELYPSGFSYSNMQRAGLYSAHRTKTVKRHLQWMQEYNVDGVFVQRFVIEAVQMKNVRDQVLKNVQEGAEEYGRVFANMWDISGWHDEPSLIEDMKQDWIHLVDDLRITESPSYLYHNNRPVVSIWGFGFDSRGSSPFAALSFINWLKFTAPAKYRATVMGGVPTDWRTDTEWENVYKAYDIISPWTVGRYNGLVGADEHKRNMIEPDLLKTQILGNEYLPVVFPGFSFKNAKPDKPFNEMPRIGGTFYWRQLYNAIDAGSKMVYIAMFDEVDEGTAIFKLAATQCDIPATGKFLTLDHDIGYQCVPNDWYLRLTGNATEYFRNEGALPLRMPELPTSCEPCSMSPYGESPFVILLQLVLNAILNLILASIAQ